MSTSREEVFDFSEVILRAPAELIRHAEILAVWQQRRLNEVIVEALERYMADPPVQMQIDRPETPNP